MADGVSKCGRKSALAVFFGLSLIAFLFCLLSLLSPSWQYAYLENGRTEHHHGLWLDCKRDYSFDYGRTREYYETLYRRDMQGSPFEMFFLPPLQCVYKFDYYIDPEDLYDHDHDENRLQNDANQHLFLGWKVAALAAVGVAVCFSGVAILLGICSFCHRTFICACTVLTTIAAILSTVGLVVFYMWANYQDNKVIKEEEDLSYEQFLGWAFHFQVIGAVLHWFASMMGCCVTSISLSKSRAKLVKIEVVEGDDSMLLSNQSSQPFKRSFSAIYRVDSQALRQWERDYLRNTQQQNNNEVAENNFKRTASVPNFSKKQRKQDRKKARALGRSNQDLFTSTSNITESTRTGSNFTLDTHRTRDTTQTAPAPLAPTTPSKPTILKSALKTPQLSRRTLNDSIDPTYEYLPCPSSMGVSSFMGGTLRPHDYDSVYEQIGPDTYLEPNSVKARASTSTLNAENQSAKRALLPSLPINHGSSQSIPASQPKTTMIDDVARPSSSDDVRREMNTQTEAMRIRERLTIEEMTRMERFKKMTKPEAVPKSIIKPPSVPPKENKPPMSIRDFGIDLSKRTPGYCTEISREIKLTERSQSSDTSANASPEKMTQRNIQTPGPSAASVRNIELDRSDERLRALSGRLSSSGSSPPRGSQSHRQESSVDDLPDPPPGIAINTFGFGSAANRRSITNLTFRPVGGNATDVFDRPESIELRNERSDRKTPTNLHRSLMRLMPDEVDRSVGSSTVYENDTISEAGSYARDAEVRLNLFLNDNKNNNSQDETTV